MKPQMILTKDSEVLGVKVHSFRQTNGWGNHMLLRNVHENSCIECNWGGGYTLKINWTYAINLKHKHWGFAFPLLLVRLHNLCHNNCLHGAESYCRR